MSIIYRHGKSEDLTDVQTVVAAAFNDLNERRGFGASFGSNSSPPNPFFGFALERQPDGFWVAEDNGRVVGFSISQLYGSFWFLAYLFVMPDHQGKGLGRELLKRTGELGAGIPVTNRALITFAYNPESISLYMKHGLYPCQSVYWVTGAGEEVGARLGDKPDRGVLEPIAPGKTASALLGSLDAEVLGVNRTLLHEFLLGEQGSACYLYRQRGDAAGYAYIWTNGRIGPLAALTSAVFTEVTRNALQLAVAQSAPEIFTNLAGSNEQAVALTLGSGMRIVYPFLLMAAKPFGDWSRYLFHSPGLM